MNANAASLVCNMTNFNPRNGSILKLAVARQADDFIGDAVVNWKVDLNQIDAIDGKTVLDYITDQRTNAGPTFVTMLNRYYKLFSDGARGTRLSYRQRDLRSDGQADCSGNGACGSDAVVIR